MKRRAAVLAALVLSAAMPGIGAAEPDDELVVLAGAVDPTDPQLPFEFTRFYPEALSIHRGQTVRWEFMGSPGLGAHVVRFFDQESDPGLARADELPETFAWTERAWRDSGCGRGDEAAPCIMKDAESEISSGFDFTRPPFRVTFLAEPGTVFPYGCTIHPSMRGSVTVVPPDVALPTKEELDAVTEQQVAADAAAARARLAAASEPTSRTVDGRRVWRVLVGDSTDDAHVAVVQYLPSGLRIEAGDSVEFVIRDEVVDEFHSVSFPREAFLTTGLVAFLDACDPDDPAGGAPGVPTPLLAPPAACPSPEVLLHHAMTHETRAPGDAVAAPGTVHDSGVMVPQNAPEAFRGAPPGSGRRFPARFDATFPAPGTFRYGCVIHGATVMGGSVQVA